MRRYSRAEWEEEAEKDEREEIPADAERFVDTGGRRWIKVEVAFGAVGGRWGYWRSADTVIADRIMDIGASHFGGMLREPYSGKAGERVWMMEKQGEGND